ncbi:Rho GTPase activation protein [Rozella allomycis CSF55]|uniref:Rho GTPase activation protein n=1 Tax=Rozella allomycis (strain CSF55) TaxID=988480 RepID=A0A4P9YGS5_ROZAC|nr:Rho GTPase activation protein [Rozella allomycis CSF55]
MFEQEYGAIPIEDGEFLSDINSITGVLKLFLKQLPEALISKPGYEEFLEVCVKSCEIGEKIEGYKMLVNKLDKVCTHHRDNKMTPVAMGSVFAPLFFRSVKEETSIPFADQIVEILIEKADEIFSEVN